jgi:hypothetical protein
MQTVRRDFSFLPENKAAVAMQTRTLPDGSKELTFAVAFCRHGSPKGKPNDTFDKGVAETVLRDRLDSESRASKYTRTIVYQGKSPKRDKLVPFIHWVRNTLANPRRKARNIDRIFSRLPRWSGQTQALEKGVALQAAQEASICGTAIRKNTSIGDVLWPKNSDVAYSGRDTYAPMRKDASEKQARFLDWEPLVPRKLPRPHSVKGTRKETLHIDRVV